MNHYPFIYVTREEIEDCTESYDDERILYAGTDRERAEFAVPSEPIPNTSYSVEVWLEGHAILSYNPYDASQAAHARTHLDFFRKGYEAALYNLRQQP